ncbi:MAG: ATP synthase F1 subunit delta [Nitrospiria bacterium]
MGTAERQVDNVASGYSQAILAVARAEGLLDKVEGELTQLQEVLEKNPSLLDFLKDRKVTREGKEKALGEILGESVSSVTRHHVSLVADQGRGLLLPEIVRSFFRLAAESRKKTTARIVTAVPLSEATEKNLEKTLSGILGEAVFIKKSVDPSLLGGIVVHMDERIIDGSLRGRLNRLRGEISTKILSEKGRTGED